MAGRSDALISDETDILPEPGKPGKQKAKPSEEVRALPYKHALTD
jgi:hypothetical protein